MENLWKKTVTIGAAAVFVLLLAFSGSIVENLDSGHYAVLQDAVDGELHVFTSPGVYSQWFGKITIYPQSFQYEFEQEKEDNKVIKDTRVEGFFNDGAKGWFSGSVRVEIPSDPKKLLLIHQKFRSFENLETQLIKPVITKAVVSTAPLMSSKESYAERRNEIIALVEDQAVNGAFKTMSIQARAEDPLTGKEKTITKVEILKDSLAPRGKAREETSSFQELGLKLFNVTLTALEYDKIVVDQIAAQQNATMQVQTAMAKAKEAEQRAITVEQEGKADAAKARWEMEVTKAQAVTEAEKKRDVAKLERDEAEYIKQKDILIGEGEAAKKRLIQAANNSLELRLEAWKEINKFYAEALKGARITPEIVIGNTQGSSNNAMGLIDLLTIKTAKDLAGEIGPKQ